MPSRGQQFGQAAEQRAAEFLQQQGFTILDRHVTSRYGEIDILAQDGATIVAVEVKARRSQRFGRAVESMTKRKLQRVVDTLHDYLRENGLEDRAYRIDLITFDQANMAHLRSIGE